MSLTGSGATKAGASPAVVGLVRRNASCFREHGRHYMRRPRADA